jgi:hypothetical protein
MRDPQGAVGEEIAEGGHRRHEDHRSRRLGQREAHR